MLGLVVQYGFDSWATRDAAAARDDRDALASIAARVLGAKLLLIAVSLLIAGAGLLFVTKLRANPDLLALAWLAAIASGLVPTWLFVGLEKIRPIAILQLLLRVISAGLTFVFVQDSGDAAVVLALYAAASILAALITTGWMYRIVPFRRPRVHGAVATLRSAWPLFVASASVTLYTALNVVLLGLFVPSGEVAQFGAAERIVRAALQFLGPVGIAVYPRLAFLQSTGERERAKRLLWIAGAVVAAIGLSIAAVLIVAAPAVIRVVFGSEYADAVPVLRTLALLMPLNIAGSLCAAWLLTLHQDRTVVHIVLLAGLVNVAVACVLAPLFGPEGMAVSVVLAELAGAAAAIAAVRRLGRAHARTASAKPAPPRTSVAEAGEPQPETNPLGA